VVLLISEPTSVDLKAVHASVSRRSAAELNAHDRDDIAAQVISAAWSAASERKDAFWPLAVSASHRPRYYSDARSRVRTTRTTLQPDDAGLVARALTANPLMTGSLVNRPGCSRPVEQSAPSDIEVWDLVNRLPQNHARAFWLVHWLGYTLMEASGVLGVSFKTIDRWQAKARQALADAYTAVEAA
jgi:DNA-directed RNA polymerase specialized sigma24 family protein